MAIKNLQVERDKGDYAEISSSEPIYHKRKWNDNEKNNEKELKRKFK